MRRWYVVAVVLMTCELEEEPLPPEQLRQAVIGAPRIFASLSTTPRPNAASNPTRFVALSPTLTMFSARVDGTGDFGLWVTDGTAAGTKLLLDTETFPQVALNDAGYLIADGLDGYELWRTDGTPTGTSNVFDVPGNGSYRAVAHDGMIFTSSYPSNIGVHAVYVSDGTTAGSRRIGGVLTGNPRQLLTGAGGRAYFDCCGLAGTAYVWEANPADGGLRRIDATQSNPLELVEFGGTLYFVNGRVHRYDQATATVVRADSLTIGTTAHTLRVVGGRLVVIARQFMSAADGVYVIDGPDSGTVKVGANYDLITEATAFNGRLAFVAGGADRELYVMDISDGGTQLLNLAPTASSAPDELTALNGLLYFEATVPGSGQEPWVTDGTPAGTMMLVDATPGDAGSGVTGFGAVGSDVLFGAAAPGGGGIELWRTGGTPATTTFVADLAAPRLDTDPVEMTELAGGVVFAASNGSGGLWFSDGTDAGTVQLAPGTMRSLQRTHDRVYAIDDTGVLWRTDGTAAGTEALSNAGLGAAGNQRHICTTRDAYYLLHVPSMQWRLDVVTAADAGRSTVATFVATTTRAPWGCATVGDRVFFHVPTDAGYELTVSDGTVAGTRPSYPRTLAGPGSDVTGRGYEWQGELVYSVQFQGLVRTRDAGSSWVTLDQGATNSGAAVGDLLFYPRGRALWATGFDAGTARLVRDMGDAGGLGQTIRSWNGRAVFQGDDGTGLQLWLSDGTSAGTRPIANPGVFLPLQNGSLLVTRWTPEYGSELYAVDPSSFAMSLVADLAPGPESSDPKAFTAGQNLVYFSASDGTGTKLWVVDRQTWDGGTSGAGGGAAGGGGANGGGAAGGSAGGAAGGMAGGSAGGTGGGATGGTGGGAAGGTAGGGSEAMPGGCGCGLGGGELLLLAVLWIRRMRRSRSR